MAMHHSVQELEALFKVWTNTTRIAAVRGFAIPPALLDCTYSDFCYMAEKWTAIRGPASARLFYKPDDSAERLLIVWPNMLHIKEVHVSSLLATCDKLRVTQIVLIVTGSIRDNALRLLADHKLARQISVHVFYEYELRDASYPCASLLFPETQVVCDQHQIDEILAKRGLVSPKELTPISHTEFESRCLGLQPGDVVRIVCGERRARHTSSRVVI